MSAPIGRLWGRRDADGIQGGVSPASAAPDDESDLAPPAAAEPVEMAAVADASADTDPAAPEQPVLLTPVGTTRQVHVGDVLPPARRGWPGPLSRLPAVPKRAILAAGVCAGLVAPALARHLATRLLLGPGAKATSIPSGTIEITKIVYQGPATAEVMSAIIKSLIPGRR